MNRRGKREGGRGLDNGWRLSQPITERKNQDAIFEFSLLMFLPQVLKKVLVTVIYEIQLTHFKQTI